MIGLDGGISIDRRVSICGDLPMVSQGEYPGVTLFGFYSGIGIGIH